MRQKRAAERDEQASLRTQVSYSLNLPFSFLVADVVQVEAMETEQEELTESLAEASREAAELRAALALEGLGPGIGTSQL